VHSEEEAELYLPQLGWVEETSAMNEFVEDVDPTNTKIFEKKVFGRAQLKKIMKELHETNDKCEILQNIRPACPSGDIVYNLHAEIESQQIILSHLQTKISDLEAFYLGFRYQQDGGSSSSNNDFTKKRLAKIIEECKAEESWVDIEKGEVEDARSRLYFLREIKDNPS